MSLNRTMGAVAIGSALFLLWGWMRPVPEPVSVAVPAVPAPEVAKTPKVETPIAFKAVKAYPKAAKRKLGLPVHTQADDNKQVIEAVQIPAGDYKKTVSCVQDTQTGEAEIFVRRDPPPLIATSYSGDAGIYLGLMNGAPALKLEARQSFLTVKAIHFGVTGSLVQPISGLAMPPTTFVGGGIWGGWK